MKLPKKALMKAIGKIIYNNDGRKIGRLTDITEDESHNPNFIIVSTDDLPGFGSKYFAIPVIHVSVKNEDDCLILKLHIKALKQAVDIDFEQTVVLKKPSTSTVFQLKGYHGAKNDATVKYYA